jgi:hypothetical protein
MFWYPLWPGAVERAVTAPPHSPRNCAQDAGVLGANSWGSEQPSPVEMC